MLILLRTNDIYRDPRVQKYLNFYNEENIKYKVIGWDRDNQDLKNENIIFYKKESPYGAGSKNIKNILLWNIFLLKKLYKMRTEYIYIHACDFDTVLPACIMKLFGKKVIFDIFDMYTDSRDIKNKAIKYILGKLECFAILFSNKIIICDKEREEQLPISIKKNKILLMPNIPNINFRKENMKEKYEEYKLKISYVGVFEEYRGIKDILEVVSKNSNICLTIAGYGSLLEIIKEYANKYKNIIFLGKVEYNKGLNIMNDSDLIIAFYYTESRNNIYAAPNKYYESLYLGVPLLTNVGTLLSKKISKYDTGFIISEGEESIETFFNTIKKDQIKVKGQEAYKIWNLLYRNGIKEYLINYSKYILGEKNDLY